MKNRWLSYFCLSIFVGYSTVAVADGHHQKPLKFKVTPLTDSLFMLQGKGGNLALQTGEDGLLMVDSDYQDMTPALQKALQSFGGEQQLKYIINTHWHGDHTQGNLTLGQHADIVAHHNVRQRLSASQTVKRFNLVSKPYPEEALPNISYQQELNLHINGEQIELRHYGKGHTDGDTVVFFKNANVVHMGDLFFNGFYPFVDVDNAGNAVAVADRLHQILPLLNDQTQVIPGHGPLADKQALTAFHDMLKGTIAEVAAMQQEGMSLKQAQKAGISDRWKEWENGFIPQPDWIEIVYRSLEAR